MVIIVPSADRRGKTKLVVLVSIFVVLGIVVAWMWRKPATQPSVDEGRAITEKFLEQIRAGQVAEAWESTTAEFKSFEGRESFVRSVKKTPALTKTLSFVSVQTATVQGSPRAEYIFRAAEGGGRVRLLAGNDHGAWRVDRMVVE